MMVPSFWVSMKKVFSAPNSSLSSVPTKNRKNKCVKHTRHLLLALSLGVSHSAFAVYIDKDAVTPTAAPGGQATYSIVIVNDFNIDINNWTVKDTLPADLTFSSASYVVSTGASGTLTNFGAPSDVQLGAAWSNAFNPNSVIDVPGNGTFTITLVVNIAASATLGTVFQNDVVAIDGPRDLNNIDDAAASGGGFGEPPISVDPEDDDNVTIVSVPVLTIDKDTSTPTLTAGSQAVYTIVVENTGTVDATNISISDDFSAGFTFASATHIFEGGVTGPAIPANSGSSSVPVFSAYDIPAGGKLTIHLIADVSASIGVGTYDNTASATADGGVSINDDGLAAQDGDTPAGQDPEDDEDVTIGPIVIQDNATPSCTTPAGGGDIRWTNALVNVLTDSANPTIPTPLTWTEEDGIGVTMTYVDQTQQNGGTALMDYTSSNVGGDAGVIAFNQDGANSGDYMQVVLDFDEPVTGLTPTSADVDIRTSGGNYRDTIIYQAFLNGVPVEPSEVIHGDKTAVAIAPSALAIEEVCQSANNLAGIQASPTAPCFYGIGNNSPNTLPNGNARAVYNTPVDKIITTYVSYRATGSGDATNNFTTLNDFCWAGIVKPVDLSITKTSNTSGAPVSPGDTISYTIVVESIDAGTATNVALSDIIPTGTTYVANSTEVIVPISTSAAKNYRDEFGAAAYNNSDGTQVWTSTWVESGDDGTATGGRVKVDAGKLSFFNMDSRVIERAVDFSSADVAQPVTLTWDWQRVNGNESVKVQLFVGGAWQDVGSASGSGTGSETYILTTAQKAATAMRFVGGDNNWGNETVLVDNVNFAFTGTTLAVGTLDNIPAGANADLNDGTPSAMVTTADGIMLAAGETMTVTYDVTVDAGASVSPLVNTATVDSAETDPLSDTAEDILATTAAPGVFIDKDTSTPDILPGGFARYSIVVSNTLATSAPNFIITDDLPAGFTLISATYTISNGTQGVAVNYGTSSALSFGAASNATNNTDTVYDIPADGNVTIDMLVAVDTSLPVGTTYHNTASAKDGSGDLNLDDDGTVAQDSDTPPNEDPTDDEDIYLVGTPLGATVGSSFTPSDVNISGTLSCPVSVNTDTSYVSLLAGNTVTTSDGVGLTLSTTTDGVNGGLAAVKHDGVPGNIEPGIHLNKTFESNFTGLGSTITSTAGTSTGTITYTFDEPISALSLKFQIMQDEEKVTFSHPATSVTNHLNSTFAAFGTGASPIMSEATLENGGLELRSHMTGIVGTLTDPRSYGAVTTVSWNFPTAITSFTVTHTGRQSFFDVTGAFPIELAVAGDGGLTGARTNGVTRHDGLVIAGNYTFLREACLPVGANIQVEKVLDTSPPYLVGQTVTYIITVTNNGPDAASNVVIDDLPNNLNITSVASPNCTAFPCTIATMADGAVETITVTGVVQ